MTKRIGVGLLAFGILLSFFVYFYATSTSPADISQDDALFLDAGLLDDPLDELLNEGEADIPIDDIETDDPALLNQQSAATVIAYSPNASQVGAVVAAGESGWRDDQEDKTYNKPPYGYAGNVRANGEATGWAYDPDEPKTAISVHAYIDGKAGVGTFIGSTKADKNRSDITEGETSYNHWYSFSIPEEYKDGKTHTLYTYGIDAKGLSAKNNALLKNNPKTFKLVSIATLPPSCTLTASPASITSGQSSTLSWTSTNATSEANVDVTTGGDTTKPTVTLTAPAASSTVSSTVTFRANATDNVGVAGGQCKGDGANVGAEDTTAPYSISCNSTTATNGTHNIRAVARDAAGNTRWSAVRSVTVSNGTADTDIITVQGNKILRNGQPFIMKGVVFDSFKYTDADLAVCSVPSHPDYNKCQKGRDARDYYFGRGAFTSDNDMFSVLPQWGANTIRLNLGQAPLDPQSPYYDAAYVQTVADVVKRARDRGYIVVVSPFSFHANRFLSYNLGSPLD